VAFDASAPEPLAAFWGTLLGREVVEESSGALLPGVPTQVGLRFVRASTPGSSGDRLHLHLTSTTADDQQQTVDTALGLGSRHLDVGQLPEEDHVVLEDPGGNAFCVVGPGNRFLAGCGRLGEVACDGSRDVGLFWHEVLCWPLVWDQDQETAVQSPSGGTKIAWGGPPVAPKVGRNRQRFHLAAEDPVSEVARMAALGASLLGERDGGVELADPDGNEFRVAPV
jgi:Glyoxalase-like domain